MSRDFTPKELRFASEGLPNLVDTLITSEGELVFSEEERALSHKYSVLGRCGFDFLMLAKDLGILNSEQGQIIISKIDNYLLNGDNIEKPLMDATDLWYEGQLYPDYYMNHNDMAFVEFIKAYIQKASDP